MKDVIKGDVVIRAEKNGLKRVTSENKTQETRNALF